MILSDRYRRALEFAFELHRHQSRKGSGVPYVAHVLGVSSLVLECGGDEDLAIAALLHDAVEDQGGVVVGEQIRELFGDRVANVVLACSDSWGADRSPWRERKEAYIAKLGTTSSDAHLVASCDKLYNLQTIVDDLLANGAEVWTRFSGGRDGVVWYYSQLSAALIMPPSTARRFSWLLAQLSELAK